MNVRINEFVVLFIAFVGVASLLVFAEHPYNRTRERDSLTILLTSVE